MAVFHRHSPIITGASTGRSIMAKMMVAEGAKVVMGRGVELVESSCQRSAIRVARRRRDARSRCAAMVDVAMKNGAKVDVMMNQSAVPHDKFHLEQTLENWKATIGSI